LTAFFLCLLSHFFICLVIFSCIQFIVMIYLQICDLLFSPETFCDNWYCPSIQTQHFILPIVKSKLKSQLFSPLFDFCFQAHWSLFYACTAQGLARIWVEFTGRFLGCPMCLPYLWDISLTFQPFWHL